MKMIADLHIHSRYSMATSKDGNPENLDLWARKKGISLIGTGDFTHFAWREEVLEKLIPAEDGLYRLKEEYVALEARKYPGEAPRFVITGEISSVYKKSTGSQGEFIMYLYFQGWKQRSSCQIELEKIGNIHSDGRPILGLDSHDLLELMLDTCPVGMLVPAHIWTAAFIQYLAPCCQISKYGRMFWRSDTLCACCGNGVIFRSGYELAVILTGCLSAYFQFGCSFSFRESWGGRQIFWI